MTKFCNKCELEKDINEFHLNSSHKDGHESRCKVCSNLLTRDWQMRFPEKQRGYRHACYKRVYATSRGKLDNLMGSHIRECLKGSKRGRRWSELVGYTVNQLKIHLEAQFEPWMSWDNHGEWHIDHILPIVSFHYETPEEDDFKKCWSLQNLRPLEALENMRKGCRLIT